LNVKGKLLLEELFDSAFSNHAAFNATRLEFVFDHCSGWSGDPWFETIDHDQSIVMISCKTLLLKRVRTAKPERA
jgi:hypothetical protein